MFEIRSHKNGKVSVKEKYGRPLVYLDNWALNDLALDDQIRKRFIKAMRKQNATIRISIQNIDELRKQGDWDQIKSILKMLDSIDSGFININANEVIKKENAIIKNPYVKHENPTKEIDLIISRLQYQTLPIKPSIAEIIEIATTNATPKKYKDIAFANLMKNKLEQGRGVETIERAKKRFHKVKQQGKQYDAATRELTKMAYDFIIMNRTMKMSKSSEWYDLNHVIVPVAYCDVVLLDKKWRAFIIQTELTFPDIAMVFDKSMLEEFFKELETNEFKQVNVNWRGKIKA